MTAPLEQMLEKGLLPTAVEEFELQRGLDSSSLGAYLYAQAVSDVKGMLEDMHSMEPRPSLMPDTSAATGLGPSLDAMFSDNEED